MKHYKSYELRCLLEDLMQNIVAADITSDGLSYGRSGVALLYAYYSRFTGKAYFQEQANHLISEVFGNFSTPESTITQPDYYNGLIGFLWVVDHLHRWGFIELDGDEFDYLDSLVFDWTHNRLENGDFDFFSGGGGGLNYLVHKYGRIPKKRLQLKQLFEAFKAGRVNTETATVYINRAYNAGEGFTENTINYGFAHGVGGPAVFLAKAAENDVIKDETLGEFLSIIDTFQSLSSSFEVSENFGYANMYDYVLDKPMVQQRLGWCVGDLNQIHLEVLANHLAPDERFQASINKNFKKIISRDQYDLNNISDPYLCHGFSGVLVYVQYLGRHVPGVESSRFQKYCIDGILSHYQKYADHNNDTSSKVDSFFYGDIGVALSIISTLDPQLSNWAELILI